MSKKKKIIIACIVSVVIIGIIVAVLAVLKNKTKDKKVVDVYPVSELAYPSDMFEYDNYYYGNVNAGLEQNIYLMSSQKIEEIKVTEGQEVKAGDVILVYDTTAQELALDIEKANVEIARAAVVVAERELEELKKITPVEEIPVVPEPEEIATPTDAATSTDAPEEIPEVPEAPEIPEEDVYTKEELDKAIKDKEAEIRTLSIAYQLAQIDLQIMEQQNSNGEVVANFDGVVKTIIDEEEAILNSKPLIVISGDSGYTVTSNIGELSLGTVAIGDMVEMYCYENGMNYTGTIAEISDTPVYSDNTESYYNIKINVENTDGLTSGMGMDVTMSSDSGEDNTFYIPLAYVAEENGNYYVLKEENGVLKKVYIKTGKIMWGDSIKVYSGVTMNDYIAFPHSKDAVEGVKTKQASAYDMYY
ncbi:MAG: HlyD family efflux transporter periplasmic adaptor subunit [Lachnospiraceae bacterium]|nr:HlyD family efflux transporter periplasmic adaptor subunit [Lachnospiraceae bacterium]